MTLEAIIHKQFYTVLFLYEQLLSDKGIWIIEYTCIIHSTKKVIPPPPPSIFSYISKSILPILIIQTVMDMEFSYAKN